MPLIYGENFIYCMEGNLELEVDFQVPDAIVCINNLHFLAIWSFW